MPGKEEFMKEKRSIHDTCHSWALKEGCLVSSTLGTESQQKSHPALLCRLQFQATLYLLALYSVDMVSPQDKVKIVCLCFTVSGDFVGKT